jgi:hypothetical protein
MTKLLNSLLQNQNLRGRALSSKPASLLGKFPDGEVATDASGTTKTGRSCTWTRSSHQEEKAPQHRFWSQT